jgi:hypothetical protein
MAGTLGEIGLTTDLVMAAVRIPATGGGIGASEPFHHFPKLPDNGRMRKPYASDISRDKLGQRHAES